MAVYAIQPFGMSQGKIVTQSREEEQILQLVINDSTIYRKYVEDGDVTLYAQTPLGEKWSIRITVLGDDAEAKKKFKKVCSEPTSAPYSLDFALGNEAMAWRSPRGGMLVFRRGSVVIKVDGAIDWKELINKSKLLDRKFINKDFIEDLKSVYRLKEVAQEVIGDSVKNAISHSEINDLIEELKSSGEPHREQQIILKLMNARSKVSVPVLISRLDSKYPITTRTQAIKALGECADKRAPDQLLSILREPVKGNISDEGEDEAILRRNTINALRKIKDPTTLSLFQILAKNEQEYQSVRDLADIAVREIEEEK